MADVTPPRPPHPGQVADGAKAGAKGLGGRLKKVPKWAWVAGSIVFVGMAYLAWKRSTAGPPVADAAATDGDFQTAEQSFPTATQGAFGGGDTPGGPTPVTINISQPDATPTDNSPIPETPTQPVTGGGAPRVAAGLHSAPPKGVVAHGKFYHVFNAGKRNERWQYVRPATQIAAAREIAHLQGTPLSTPIPRAAMVAASRVTGGGPPRTAGNTAHVQAHNPTPPGLIRRPSAAHGGRQWLYRRGASGKLIPVRAA